MTDAELDRLSELTNIGAGHAATAFAELTGRPMRMEVPRVRELASDPEGEALEPASGVFFRLDGCLDGLLGILFRPAERDAILRRMFGGAQPSETEARSALMELGNILASQLASAIADTLGDRLLPSVPDVVDDGASHELAERARRVGGEHAVRIDCALVDGEGCRGGLLVVVPEATPA